MADIRSGYSDKLAIRQEEGILVPLVASLNWLADRVVLFQYREFIFVTYGLFGGLGTFVALWWLAIVLLGQGVSLAAFAVLTFSGSLGALLFSRLAGLALDYRQLLRHPVKTLRSVTFVSWGGILGIALVLIGFGLATDYELLLLLDASALALPLGHAIGRLGCLAYGCCFGRPTRFPLAVVYTNPQAKVVRTRGLQDIPLHPAPLYEVALNLGLFGLLTGLAFLGAPQGVPTTLYLLLYGLGRFAIEFTRDNEGRIVWRALAVNHILALGLVAFGVAFLPVVLIFGAASSPISLAAGLKEGLPLLPWLVFCGFILFAGLSLHRKTVGVW